MFKFEAWRSSKTFIYIQIVKKIFNVKVIFIYYNYRTKLYIMNKKLIIIILVINYNPFILNNYNKNIN